MTPSEEFLGLPLPVWNLLATLILAALTGVYVVITRKTAKTALAAASAALASVEVVLEAAYYHFALGKTDSGIVRVQNLGGNLHVHGVSVRDFFFKGQKGEEESVAWEDESPVPLVPVETWGPMPWLLHKGEQRTFHWPTGKVRPNHETALVSMSIHYSVGLKGQVEWVQVPLKLEAV